MEVVASLTRRWTFRENFRKRAHRIDQHRIIVPEGAERQFPGQRPDGEIHPPVGFLHTQDHSFFRVRLIDAQTFPIQFLQIIQRIISHGIGVLIIVHHAVSRKLPKHRTRNDGGNSVLFQDVETEELPSLIRVIIGTDAVVKNPPGLSVPAELFP